MSNTETLLKLNDIPKKMELAGVVKAINLAGAVINVGAESDALLHISQIKAGRVNNVGDHLEVGQEITVWAQKIDSGQGRLSVTMIQPPAVSWDEIAKGKVYTGKVVRLEKFGVFVDIGAERPGLVHISELATSYVKAPSDVVSQDQEVQVQVIGVNRRKNQIDLSIKALLAEEEAEVINTFNDDDDREEVPTIMAMALQRAMSKGGDDKDSGGTAKSSKKRQEQQSDLLKRTLEQHASQD